MAESTTVGAPGRVGSPRWLLIVLYIAAAILVARASVEQNQPPFPLEDYASGHAGMPYQARCLMVPVLRWAGHSPLIGRAASAMEHSSQGPQQLMVQMVDSLCLIAAGWAVLRLRRQFVPAAIFPWLAPWLMLWVVAITYAVRYDQRLFLPYDFVSLLVFSIGLIACLEARAWLLLLVMLVGTYNRETTLFLLPVWLIANWKDRRASGIWIAAAGALVWTGVKLHIRSLLGGAPAGLQFNWNWNLAAILLPHHWAQLLSVGGYLALPIWFGRGLVADPRLRAVWLGLIPFFAANLVFGVWNETRIFGELSLLFAVTATVEFEQLVRCRDIPRTAAEPEGI